MSEVNNILEKLCSQCIAEFNGGFPNFNIEELKKTWKGQGYCIRCNTKLDNCQICGRKEAEPIEVEVIETGFLGLGFKHKRTRLLCADCAKVAKGCGSIV